MNIFYKIIDFFKYLPQEIKYFCQRGIRGYSDRDVLGIDEWFLNIIVPMLEQLKETKLGYPSDLTSEQWNDILDRIIFCFKEANEETCSMVNEYETDFMFGIFGNLEKESKELENNYFKRAEEIENYQLQMKEEAFKLFSKYFHALWN